MKKLLVLPSLRLCRGTPAIVYDNTAQPELITPETGLVVENGDIEGVKRLLKKFVLREKIIIQKHAVSMHWNMMRERFIKNI